MMDNIKDFEPYTREWFLALAKIVLYEDQPFNKLSFDNLRALIDYAEKLTREIGQKEEPAEETLPEPELPKYEAIIAQEKPSEDEQKRVQEIYTRVFQEAGVPNTPSRRARIKLCIEAGEQCMYCGTPITLTQALEAMVANVDHIVPKEQMGRNMQANKVCSCKKCNDAKKGMRPSEFVPKMGPEFVRRYIERVQSNPRMTDAKKALLLEGIISE